MKAIHTLIVVLLMTVGGTCSLMAQNTSLYKRVMVVKNGNKTPKNDDAHYITISGTTCYDSDENGYEASGKYLKFTKDENNLHCYYGRCHWGYAHYYFSDDYSRLNVYTNDNIVHVYQREPSGTTTAARRPEPANSGDNVYSTPSQPSISSGGSSSGSSGSSSQNTMTRKKCPYCGGGGGCSSCNGTGHKFNGYSGHEDFCPSCNGNRRCPICRGTGRL